MSLRSRSSSWESSQCGNGGGPVYDDTLQMAPKERDHRWNQTKLAKIPVSMRWLSDTLLQKCVLGSRGQGKRNQDRLDMVHPRSEALVFSTPPPRLPMRPSHPSNNRILTCPTSLQGAVHLALVKHVLRSLKDRQRVHTHHPPTSQRPTHIQG